MTEGETAPVERGSNRPSNSSSSRDRGGRGGRGSRGGRGRGRGGGRGGRGRGRGGKQSPEDKKVADDKRVKKEKKDINSTASPPEKTGENAEAAAPRNGSAGRGRGGRGRSSGGRGRSRGGRGGKKGRGGRQSKKVSRPNSPTREEHEEADTAVPESTEETPDQQESAKTTRTTDETLVKDEQIVEGKREGIDGQNASITAVFETKSQLALPSPPKAFGGRGGVPMILSRHSHPPARVSIDHDSEAQKLSERLATAALEDSFGSEEEKKEAAISEEIVDIKPSKKSKKKSKKKKEKESTPPPEEPEEQAEITTTQAIKAMPAQEVSITANTTVQIRRSESNASLTKSDDVSKTKGSKAKKGKSKKKKGLSKDDAANQKAAKAFNKSVRLCVERSDPESMRDILHDKQNHHFALDKNVLETVMKAYVMAAMFEDALYCLRNCTLPGTLSTMQTEKILTCLPQNLRNSSAYTAADMINALCIATEFDNATSRTYFLRIVRGISLEFLEEVMSARDRICSAPCERLVRAAVCVVDVRLKRGKKPTELLVVAGDQLGVFVPDSMENRGIQAGDAVSLLPYAGPYPMSAESLDRNMIEATVTNTNPMVLRLQDKTNAKLHDMLTENVDGNVYRVDKLANRMGFNRQLAAAVAIASPLGESKTRDTRRPCSELIKAITAMDENIDRVMNLSGGMFKGVLTSTAALCAQAVPWNHEDESEDADEDAFRMTSKLALDKYGALEGLNASQRLAVEGAVTNRLTLVQGPPGTGKNLSAGSLCIVFLPSYKTLLFTGKTAVAIRILQHWARLAESNAPRGENPLPILATSDSNIAVDNLVEGCAAVGLRVVRLGRPEAIRPELLRFCIDRPPSSYNQGNSQQYGSNPTTAFKERMKALKKAQIICCTCIGSGGDILDTMTFDRVLVDEATQATEPAMLVPLMRGCRQLVLVGDHCQLPPTVLSTRAEEEGHGVPLFSRMVACGVPPFMLDTQYRMHPCIAMFPSDLFYGGKLLNGVTAPERRPLAGFPWPREEFPVAYVPVKGVEMDDGVSKMNEAEAAAACDAVAALLSGGQCTASDIAVVTPYAAQARLIRRMTRRLTQNSGPPYIEVSSVDGFQGREKEAVVFSAVRSNDYGAIGFTSDWRRVNVSFTRARRALIVIGNDQTLRRGDPDTWMPWLAWADAHGLNMDKPGVPRGRYDPEQLRRVRGGTTAAEMLKDVLARQQAQLKTAEKQLEKAEKNAAGHILVKDDDEDPGEKNEEKGLSLEQDLARLTNTDGNWDDSDDEDTDLHRSVSQPTLTSASSSNDRVEGSDDGSGPVDIWDL